MTTDETEVVILCGGRGTRLQERTHEIPKALVEIGAKPIIWHVINLYAVHGFRRFVLLTGYLGEQIAQFAETGPWPAGVRIRCLDTGAETPTAGRLQRALPHLNGRTFCCTYADGLADVDLGAVLEFHRGHGRLATMTVVKPRSQFGIANLDSDGRIASFEEKPMLASWVNGGFFCFESEIAQHLAADRVLEREPLDELAAAGDIFAYRHQGFWDCMDTYKDAVMLNELWASGNPPWQIEPASAAGQGEGLLA